MRQLLYAFILAFALTANPALALDKGDIILRGGAGLIFPNDDSDDLSGVPGATVGVDNSTTFAFTAGYMFHDNLAIELLGIWPANHEVEGEGILPGLGITDVGELDIFPPTGPWILASPFAPRWSKTGQCTSRPAAAWSPTATPKASTRKAATRRAR